jgi:DNA invertase Pin-like site-specific DNA recombinase
MNASQPTRAGLYARVSRSGGRDRAALELNTLRDQRESAIANLARGVDLLEDEAWIDLDVSGTHSNRPGLEAIFRAVEEGRINAVVVGYLSRFGRNARELLENVERLHAAGATLFVGKEHLRIDPGTNGPAKLILTVLAAVAEMEADRLAEGLASANANAVQRGVAIAVPYGYVRPVAGGPLALDIDETYGRAPADVVRDIFDWRLEGLGVSAITRRLNDLGVPTASKLAALRGSRRKQIAERWVHSAVAGILATHTYKGVIPQWQTEPGRGRTARIPGSLELRAGDHPVLIDPKTWERAQTTGKRPARNGNAKALLGGVVRCVSCSRTMRPSNGSGKRGLVYRCPGSQIGCTRPISIMRGPLDDYVAGVVRSRILAGTVAVPDVDTTELDAIVAQIAQTEEAIAAAKAVDAADFDADVIAMIRRYRVELDGLERRRIDLEHATTTTHSLPTVDEWDAMDVDERNALVRDLFDAVVVTPAAKRGSVGDLDERIVLVPFGESPIALSRVGVPVALQRFPLEDRPA